MAVKTTNKGSTNRLRDLGGKTLVKHNDWLLISAGALIALAVITLAGYALTRLNTAQPMVIAGMFTGLAGLLAAVPPIIKALRGGQK